MGYSRLAVLLSLPLLAQIPAEDHRNADIRGPNTHFLMPRYVSRHDWESRGRHLRRQILSAAGLLPLPLKTPLRPRIIRRLERGDYAIDTVLLETFPGYYLGGNVYRPLGRSGRFPAVLSPHGHWKRGRLENRSSYSVLALGVNLARQGYLVFAWDMVGYNDTRQTSHSFNGWREQLWSFNPLGLQLWNSIRAVDFVQSLEEVDDRRVAATGASGGATQTFLLTAVDPRVRYSAPVNMISAYMQGADPCEEAPNLRLDTFNVEIAALMAPRPMLVVSSTGDWTRHTPKGEFPAIRSVYQLFERPENVANVHLDAEHNYNRQSREAVYRFFADRVHSRGEDLSTADRDFREEKDQDMLALSQNSLPSGALDYDGLFAQWRAAAQRQTDETRSSRRLRERLRYALGAEWPERVWSESNKQRVVLSREKRQDRVPGIWIAGRGTPVLVVHPNGADEARSIRPVQQYLARGRPVLLIDAFQTGSARARRDRSQEYFLSYNQTDDANRVQDILTALRFLRSQYRGDIELAGFGNAAVWCLFAAALAPLDVMLTADIGGFSGSDEDFRDRFFVPGIQRAGGLAAALRLLR